jgi:homoserine O-acetyltransferase
VLPELKVSYSTLGSSANPAVLVLHGTGGSGTGMLMPSYWGPLFDAGEPLDANRYYVILPDGIGAGKSAKPSDGLRAAFPKYNYEDMVRAQYRLVTEHLGVAKLRLVIGNSMGGMHTWMWGTMYPEAMAALVPLAAMPTEVAGRNWLTRRMLIDLIRNDPQYAGGNYTSQPKGLQLGQVYFGFATSGGNQGLHKLAPTNAKADELMNRRLAEPTRADANDLLYQFEASKGYNPSPQLERIAAKLLAINSADDERNPPELGIMEREIKRVKDGRYVLIPGAEDTRGHGTTAMASLWKHHLAELLKEVSR